MFDIATEDHRPPEGFRYVQNSDECDLQKPRTSDYYNRPANFHQPTIDYLKSKPKKIGLRLYNRYRSKMDMDRVNSWSSMLQLFFLHLSQEFWNLRLVLADWPYST
jgi:hypothetical protein